MDPALPHVFRMLARLRTGNYPFSGEYN